MAMTIAVRLSDASTFSVTLPEDVAAHATVLDLKKAIEPACSPACPPEQQRLVYKGRILKDADSLESYGLEDGHTVHLVKARAATSSGSSSAAPSLASSSTPSRAAPPLSAAAAPFGMPSEESMREMMENPMVQSMMSNPEFMRSIMMSNPSTRALMEANPEVARALSDPDTLRTMSRAASNPEVMREMMRGNDAALRNIESLPGGFNALRRMYETIQEPLERSLAETGGDAGGDAAAPSTGGGGVSTPASAPMPNPWARAPAAPAATGGMNPFMGAGFGFPRAGGMGFPVMPPVAAVPPAGTPAAAPAGAPPAAAPAAAPPAAAPAGAPAANPMAEMMAAMMGGGGMGGGMPGMPGMGGMPGMAGGMGADPAAAVAAMQNPAMQSMMQSLMASPGFLEMVEAGNPQLRAMLDGTPGLRDMMRDPEFLRMALNPATLSMMAGMQGGGGGGMPGMFGGGGMPGMFGGVPPVPAAPGAPAPAGGVPPFGGMNPFAAMMAGGGGGGGMPGLAALLAARGGGMGGGAPAGEAYAEQLRQMEEMGFSNREQNLRALSATGGNVQAAINRIMDGLS